MSVSTDGQICFGITLKEETVFPWDDSEGEDGFFDGDIEKWWRATTGYKPPFEAYGADGKHLPGIGKAELDAYFQVQHDWDKQHPCPVEPVNCCSGDYPKWILAVPGSVQTARRGYPESFDPQTLTVTPEKRAALAEFCKQYKIEGGSEPAWFLSSYWG